MKRLEQASKWVIALLGVGILIGCGEDNNAEPMDPFHEYFPVTIGSWVEYEVDSVHVDEQFGTPAVHVQYLMRVVLDSAYIDAQGRNAIRLVRYVQDSIGNWIPRDVWSQFRNNTTAERTEENLRKLRMVFPVRDDQFWDLNVFNTEREREMTFAQMHLPWNAGSLSFDSTVTVVTTISPNLIDTVIDTERYAKHVGLVEKHWVETNTQYDTDSQGQLIPMTTGHRLTLTATAYGLQ